MFCTATDKKSYCILSSVHRAEILRWRERKLKYRSRCGTILPIFLAIHIMISFFMSCQLLFDNIICRDDLLYALIISSLKTERRHFSKSIQNETTFFYKHFSQVVQCIETTTIVFNNSFEFVRSITAKSKYRSFRLHTSKGTLVCSSSQLDTNLGIRISVLPIFPRNPWLMRHPTILKHSTAQSRTVIGILHGYPVVETWTQTSTLYNARGNTHASHVSERNNKR